MADLIMPGEAAKLLGLRPASLRRLLEAGVISGVVLPSGHHRYDRASIQAVIVKTPHPNVRTITRDAT